MSNRRTYTVELRPLADGGHLVVVPALPGCVTQGDSYDHALEMAREAIEGYLAVLADDGEPFPDEPEPHEIRIVGVQVSVPAAR